MAALAMLSAAACNRAETQEQTQRAAAEVKTAAARAGDKLADGWLTTRIQAQYFADDEVKARYIDVNTSDGVVTIKGFVETPAAHERALQIARNTSGVKQVNDQILIGQSPKNFDNGQRPVATTGDLPAAPATVKPVDDEQLTSSVQAAFYLDPVIKARRVDVEAHSGVVTLKGEVASEAERAQALTLARNAAGVQRVEDSLTVNAALAGASPASASTDAGIPGTAPLDDATLTSNVQAKLAGDPQSTSVTASVQNGVLELRGTVPSAAAHQRVVKAASETAGVKQVLDRLTISR
jgi:hyperosmotically inducible protein